MTLHINPLTIILPAWAVGTALIGLAKISKRKRMQQLKPARIK